VSVAYDSDIQMIDASSVRVHQQAANGKKAEQSRCRSRSACGQTTKIYALVDVGSHPICLSLSEGQVHDGRLAVKMPETLDMAERGAWANIRARPNRLKTFPFSHWVYRQRNALERIFNKLKHSRAVATRYD
jgi:hypothetical protein